MRGRAGKSLVVLAALTLPTQFGCPAPPDNKIVQLDPYTGDTPTPIKKPRQPYRPPNDYSMTPIPVQPRWPSNPMPEPTPTPVKVSGTSEPGWMPRQGISDRWRYIVIHHSADDKSTPAGMASWHKQRGWDGLGYHFVIGNGIGYGDGQVFVGERWPKQMHGAHCKTPGNEYNDHGIGICLIGDLDSHPPTAKQIRSLTNLVSYLSTQCGIPKGRVTTHGGVTHKTACPGKYFQLQTVLRNMTGGTITASSK